MSTLNKLKLSSFIVFILTGCGGSGSDEGTSGEGGSSAISAPEEHTETELISAYKEKISAEYTGNKSQSELDEVLVQKTMAKLIGSQAVNFRGFNILDKSDIPANGEVNANYSCWDGGAVKVNGSVSETSESKLTIDYNSCSPLNGSQKIQGQEHLKINSSSEEQVKLSSFFNDIYFTQTETNYKLSGYQTLEFIDKISSAGTFERYSSTYLLTTSLTDQSQVLQESELRYLLDQNNNYLSLKVTGKVVDSDFGEVSYVQEVNNNNSYNEMYEFKGASSRIKLEKQSHNLARLMVDEDNDGQYDVGIYISSIESFESLDLASVVLVKLDELSLPPTVHSPYIQGYDFRTTQAIVVEPGYYEDADTPFEELEVYYNWYINGVLVDDQHSSTFPPYKAVFGDTLEVSMVVSDGQNIIESSRYSTTIVDSPAEVVISNLPDTIRAGETVTFTVQMEDPDNLGQALSSADFISGPQGVSFDDGEVTWQTQSQGYFPDQEYLFVFANPSNAEEIQNINLTVSGLADMTLARSGIEVPYSNYSMWVGDFDGNGKNEVLSTDGRKRVFIQSSEDGSYPQSWMYPFKLPTNGDIKQVIGVNVDEDEALEILVVTEQGISLINGLDSMATAVLEQSNMRFAAVADSNHDGMLELAYIAASDGYGDDSTVYVVPLEDPTNELLNNSFVDSKEIVFANVDGDDALELVTNSGMVFDGESWESQWLSGNKFGENYVAAGDFDGDGVAEIAGAGAWGDIILYSAQTKEQLSSMDNFNTCSIIAANVDADSADELIVGDCQWGAISAYDLSDSGLVQIWSLDMQGHGSRSLSIGDSDNDGQLEAHWGTGQSSSGEDVFVVADINGETAALKENSSSIQLGSYSSAGWINSLQEDVAGIFFIPRTNSGYDGSRILTLDFDGNQTLSEQISTNWDESPYAAVTDFNNDGEEDIFLPTTETYNGSLGVKQISDMSEQWSIPGNYDDDIGVIVAKDINVDSYDDAIYANGSKLNAVDVENQNILFSYSFDGQVRDFSIANKDGKSLIAVVSDQRLFLMQKTSSSLAELDFIDVNCTRVEFGNFDQDENYELACVSSGDYWYSETTSTNVILYDISDNKLVEFSNSEIPYTVLDIAVDTSTETEQELFVSTRFGGDTAWYDDQNTYQIAKVSTSGHVLWLSPGLVGQPTHRGLNFMRNEQGGNRLMLSTSLAMYLLNN